MAESETSRALHSNSTALKTSSAVPGGSSHSKKAEPTPTPIAPHACTLQYLISIIKNLQRGSLSQ